MARSRQLPVRVPVLGTLAWVALSAGCFMPPKVALTGDGSPQGDGGGPTGSGGSGLGSGGAPGGAGGRSNGSGGSIVPGSGGSVLPGSGGSVLPGSGGSVLPGSGGTPAPGTGGRVAGSGGATGSGGAGTAPTSCPAISARASLCTQIPRFTAAASFALDGVGSEFCDIPPMEIAASALPWINPAHAVSRPATVSLRVGWSTEALWAHIHVKDAALYVDSAATLWNGDNVQLFFAGTSALTGSYSGTQDGGAMHVIVAPPANGVLARAITLYETGFGLITMATLPASYYAARQVSDGYEVELRLPWSANAAARTSGATIGFDFMIGVSDMGTGVQLEAALANRSVASSASCYDVVHPGCDDRTWCLPTLQ